LKLTHHRNLQQAGASATAAIAQSAAAEAITVDAGDSDFAKEKAETPGGVLIKDADEVKKGRSTWLSATQAMRRLRDQKATATSARR
jgi:hypothetical protein